MTPYDIALLSQELAEHMLILAALDIHAAENGPEIEKHRRAALTISQRIAGYLLVSDAFGPVMNTDAAA